MKKKRRFFGAARFTVSWSCRVCASSAVHKRRVENSRSLSHPSSDLLAAILLAKEPETEESNDLVRAMHVCPAETTTRASRQGIGRHVRFAPPRWEKGNRMFRLLEKYREKEGRERERKRTANREKRDATMVLL